MPKPKTKEDVEFLSAHIPGKEGDATDYSFKTRSQETGCAQSVNSEPLGNLS
jgi:hypothetical protein